MKVRERWRPSGVIGMVVIALFGVGMIVVAVLAVATELWGASLLDTAGRARPHPVWIAWIVAAVVFASGIYFVVTCVGYLYRVATGKVPRVQPEKRVSRAASIRSGR